MITVTVPLRTVSEANSHEHWRARQKRAKGQREVGFLACTAELVKHTKSPAVQKYVLPAVVTITRIAPRALDSDNLAGSQKHVRDGVADALGIDDRDPRVRWEYAQEKGAPKFYGVRITIERTA